MKLSTRSNSVNSLCTSMSLTRTTIWTIVYLLSELGVLLTRSIASDSIKECPKVYSPSRFLSLPDWSLGPKRKQCSTLYMIVVGLNSRSFSQRKQVIHGLSAAHRAASLHHGVCTFEHLFQTPTSTSLVLVRNTTCDSSTNVQRHPFYAPTSNVFSRSRIVPRRKQRCNL